MTQKQTDYDKTEKQSYKEYCDSDLRKTLGQNNEWLAHKTGFRDGYRFGVWQQMEKQKAEQTENHGKSRKITENHGKSQEVANCDIDHFRDSTKMMRYEIAMRAMQAFIHSYGDRGPEWIAENAVGYADALIKELER